MRDIPTDDRQYKRLVQKVQLRWLRSREFYDNEREKFERMERWYRRIEQGGSEGDENVKRLSYAFGLTERIHAKITEPLFAMGLPWAAKPKRMGDLRAAGNMEQIGRNFYANPNFQEALALSKKSMCVVGHRWEFDQWKYTVRKGRKWALAPKKVEVEVEVPGKKTIKDEGVEMVMQEVPCERPTHLGFDTEYPSWRDIRPEPQRTTIDTGAKTDMTWVIRDLGYLTIEELAREMTVDPHTRADVPFYDFERLVADAGQAARDRYARIMNGEDGVAETASAGLIIPVRFWGYEGRGGQGSRSVRNLAEAQHLEDRDKIWVCECREAGEILTIAQGKYIIHRKLDPYHVPGLKCRIENFTPIPGKLYGEGVIGAVEAEFGQLDDIHELTMDQIFRAVYKQRYVLENAVVDDDDFDSRASGLIRIKQDVVPDVRMAAADASVQAPLEEMVATESNLRGLIEFASMELDGAPGIMGTKQNHKTKGGQAQIIANMAPSFSRWQRQARVNECRRAQNMADFFEQYAHVKMPYRIYRPDGSTVFAELDRSDIETEGRGFDFTFDMDPMWGSLDQKKALRLEIFEQAVGYAKLGPAVLGHDAKLPNLSELFDDVLHSAGYSDTSSIFKRPNGEISPEEELQLIMQGSMAVDCQGNLQDHIVKHYLQAQSPVVQEAVKNGKADPQTIQKLQALVQQDLKKLQTFMANPVGAAQSQMAKAQVQLPPQAPQQ